MIEAGGLAERLIRVPVGADNILGLAPQKDRLLYVTGDAFYYGRDPERKTTLHAFDFEKRESSDIAKDILDAAAARDGKYVIVQNKDGFHRVEIEKPEEPAKISLDNLVVYRAPAVEWAVMFDEVWRRFRDYFYVRNQYQQRDNYDVIPRNKPRINPRPVILDRMNRIDVFDRVLAKHTIFSWHPPPDEIDFHFVDLAASRTKAVG